MKLAFTHLLTVGALLFLLPMAQARIRAALFCEHGPNAVRHYEISGSAGNPDNLQPCVSDTSPAGQGCDLFHSELANVPSGFGYDDFVNAKTFFLQCDSPQVAGICKKEGGVWKRKKECAGVGHEAVVTLVFDTGSQRKLRHEDLKPDMTTEKAEIDGETWMVFNYDE